MFGVILADISLFVVIYIAIYNLRSFDPENVKKTAVGLLVYFVLKLLILYKCGSADDMISNILKDSVACDFVDKIRQNQPRPR